MSKNKKWIVVVPFSGYVTTEVDAPDEKTAIEAGLQQAGEDCPRIEVLPEGRTDVQEWGFSHYLVFIVIREA